MASTPTQDDGNQRVTNAILSTKLDALTKEVQAMCGKMDRRMAALEELLHVETSDLRARCQDNATQVARLEERQKATTGVQAGLTLLLSSVAATIGAVFK